MSLFFLKSILSLLVLLSTLVALFTMFEVFGRAEKRYDVAKIKRVHRLNGRIFLLLYFFITYFCLSFIITSKSEPSPRGIFHGVLSLAVIILLAIKISFIRAYRQFSGKIPPLGITVAVLAMGMMATSGGYYLLVTKFGTDMVVDKILEYKKRGISQASEGENIPVKADLESIGRGRNLFAAKCSPCHDPSSRKSIVGPGLKSVLKNPSLPVSKRPATPENIRRQLRQPFSQMPSFAHLTEEEVTDIIAFLNTL